MTTDPPTLRRWNADQTDTILDQLVAIYLEVHHSEDPAFFNEDRYRRQLSGHMQAPGWQAVTAEQDAEMVGYIYGFTLPETTRWWRGLVTTVPDDFTVETGRRTLAISELLVRTPWRRQGIARALHDTLLATRSEERATLLVRPENTVAQNAYTSWGWRPVAQLQSSWEHAPLYDVLMIGLDDARVSAVAD